MESYDTVTMRSDRLADLIEKRLGVRGRGLEAKLRKAGRLLPRWLRHEASRLVEAERLMAHPKLRMQTDPTTLDRAYRQCEKWLKAVDPAERRKGRVLAFLGVNAANLLIVSAAFIAYLVWAGYV